MANPVSDDQFNSVFLLHPSRTGRGYNQPKIFQRTRLPNQDVHAGEISHPNFRNPNRNRFLRASFHNSSAIDPLSLEFDILQVCGICPFNRTGQTAQRKLKRVQNGALMFLVLVGVVCKIKYYTRKAFRGKDLLGCFTLGFTFNSCLLRIAFVYLVLQRKKVFRLLEYLANSSVDWALCFNRRTVHLLAWTLAFASVAVGFSYAFLIGQSISKFTLEKFMSLRSKHMNDILFEWSDEKSDSFNATDVNQLDKINFTDVGLALISFVLDFVGLTTEYLVKDVVLMASITMYRIVCSFTDLLDANPEPDTPRQIPTEIWKKYTLLCELSKGMSNAFGLILRPYHAHSYLAWVFFLVHLSFGDLGSVDVVAFLLDVAKISVINSLMAESAAANMAFRSWIHKVFGNATSLICGEHGKEIQTLILLDQLKTNPIGFRSASAIVDHAFIAKFGDTVSSHYLLLVDYFNS